MMTKTQMSLWQSIEALAQQIPFSTTKVETVLAIRLNEVRSSTHTTVVEGANVDLDQDVRIAKIDLRLGREQGDAGFLLLEIDGACIGIEQVRTHYRKLEITDTPRGRSLDDATSHSAFLPWGKLSFGFKERNPDCLAYIAFNPKKDN